MYQCSESASGSVSFWASRIRIRIRYSEVRIRGSGAASGSVLKCHGSPTLIHAIVMDFFSVRYHTDI